MDYGINETCCFTGHRSGKLPWGDNENDARCTALKRRLYDVLEGLSSSGVRRYICGMAQGSDMYFAEAVLALRRERPQVVLEAAGPCHDALPICALPGPGELLAGGAARALPAHT